MKRKRQDVVRRRKCFAVMLEKNPPRWPLKLSKRAISKLLTWGYAVFSCGYNSGEKYQLRKARRPMSPADTRNK